VVLAIAYVVAVLVVVFVASGVLPRYRATIARWRRVAEFEHHYREWVESRLQDAQDHARHYGPPPAESEKTLGLRAWLVARRAEMRRDARAVGKEVVHVAPPLAVGGGQYVRHYYFADLFDEQTFTDHEPQFRLDELATIRHELALQTVARRRDLLLPWRWIRLAFERVISLPRYLLMQAGLGSKVTGGLAARVVTVLWAILVGLAGIGSFMVALIALLRASA